MGQFLPETGRGTMRSMVEGHTPVRTCLCPSTTFLRQAQDERGGPPPRAGEEPA
jgi:hypothetical protein